MNRILVVEDEQHLADGLRFNLEAEGYQVRVVDTGEAALELLRTDPSAFDIVILDVMLPAKDGFTVMSEMRQAGQFIPTLMLTARGHADDVLQGFAAGADDYLPKPFELAILIARIRGLLRRKEWLRASAPAGYRYLGGGAEPIWRHFQIRRQVGGLRALGVARSRPDVSIDLDGSQCTSLPD